MDQKFAAAFCARDSVRVLGRRLQPFSNWHAAVLELMQSPFTGADRARTFAELYLAVEACAMVPEEDRLRVPAPPSARGWLAMLSFYWRMWRWGRRFPQELAKFYVYLGEFCASPRYYDSNGGTLKSPWELYLVARLISRGFSRQEAWALSPGKTKWYSAAFTEADGGDPNIISEVELKALQEAGYNV